MKKSPVTIEQEALLFVNCARLAFGAELLTALPAADEKAGRTPVDVALADLVPFVEVKRVDFKWHLTAPLGCKPLAVVARVWQTNVWHQTYKQTACIRCPRRVGKFLNEFKAGAFPHLAL